MSTLSQLSDAQLQEKIVHAIDAVFRTMLGHPASLHAMAGEEHGVPSARQVVGLVGFVGRACGVVYLCFDEPGAAACTADMLGLTATELADLGPEAVNDAIGELTNMVVGTFKNSLCDAGYPCKLTIPSILRGSTVSIGPIHSVRRQTHWFESRGRWITADLLLKADID
jgi:chemotaxis protein CheX